MRTEANAHRLRYPRSIKPPQKYMSGAGESSPADSDLDEFVSKSVGRPLTHQPHEEARLLADPHTPSNVKAQLTRRANNRASAARVRAAKNGELEAMRHALMKAQAQQAEHLERYKQLQAECAQTHEQLTLATTRLRALQSDNNQLETELMILRTQPASSHASIASSTLDADFADMIEHFFGDREPTPQA